MSTRWRYSRKRLKEVLAEIAVDKRLSDVLGPPFEDDFAAEVYALNNEHLEGLYRERERITLALWRRTRSKN